MSATSQRDFAAGEFTPALYARADLALYRRGLRTLRNAIVRKTGGIISRAGWLYKGTTKSNGAARLVACVFDDDQNYVLEFGNLYVRFWKNGSLITATTIGWVSGEVYSAGLGVLEGGTRYLCIVGHIAASGTEPGVGASWETVWVALTGTTYEWPTPYVSADLAALQFQASRGVLRITHKNYQPRGLYRLADAEWRLATLPRPTTLAAPAGITSTMSAGLVVSWTVTTVDSTTGTESAGGTPDTGDTLPSAGSTASISWSAVTGATSYRVYKSLYGTTHQFVTEVAASPWVDDGTLPMDPSLTPGVRSRGFTTGGTYPGVIGAYQQRILYSGSTSVPDVVYASRTAKPDDFGEESPIVDSDAMEWRVSDARAVRPRHFLEVARALIQFSNVGEHVIEGNESNIIGPGAINLRRISSNGAAAIPAPLTVDRSALYVQARGSVVRDLLPNAQGDAGSDLSLTAAHLLEGYTVLAWCHQQTPDSVVWILRSDGVVLSLTYSPDSGVIGWARHDTDGTVESIACVPESTEDAVYLIVNRSINGSTVRYVERLASRALTTLALFVGCDSAITVGPNAGGTLTIDGADYTDGSMTVVELTTSGLTSAEGVTNGDLLTFTYLGVELTAESTDAANGLWQIATNATVALLHTYINIVGPAVSGVDSMSATWTWARQTVSGLSHLEGEVVSVLGDGAVLASPNNPNHADLMVTSGAITLPTPSVYAVVGLPFTVDVETLDITATSAGKVGTGVNVKAIELYLEESFTPYAGVEPTRNTASLTDMQPMPMEDEDQNATTDPITGHRPVHVDGMSTDHGRIFLRHVDPTPLGINAIVPSGDGV